MATFGKLFTGFYGSLGLQSSKKLTAYGRQDGFPVALRLDNLQKNGLFILQARFRPEQAVPRSLAFPPPLQELLRTGQARVGFTRGNAQLSLLQFTKRLKLGEAAPAVHGFLNALARAGLSAGQTCHYCASHEPAQLVFNGKTVGQICAACQDEQTRTLAEERRFDPRSLLPLLAAGAVTVVAVALLWSLVWIGVDALFRSGGGTLQLPVKLSTFVAGLLGAGAASPVQVFRRVPHRGYWLAGLFGVVCAFVGGVLGEGILKLERAWQTAAGWPTLGELVPAVWRQATGAEGLFLFLRIACLLGLLGTAFFLARPSRPLLKL